MSQSGRDWRWVMRSLRGGADPRDVGLKLARDRQDKANPRDYAQRTVRRTRASLGLSGGMSR